MSRTAAAVRSRLARLQPLWPAAALLLLAVAVYAPGLNGGYAFDDFPNIVANTALHVTSLAWRHWSAAAFSSSASALQRPLAMLTFAANHYFTGLDPLPMKLTNIALHALNALLVLGLLRRLVAMAAPAGPRVTEWAARFGAGAWALQPINAVAVLLIVQRMEVLSHTFVFAGLWAYLCGRQAMLDGRNGWPRIVLGLGGGTCLGLLAKESAVLLPLYAFLVELCVLRFRAMRPSDARWLSGLFHAGLALALVGGVGWVLTRMELAAVYASRGYTLGERLLTEGRVLVDYLQWTLLPRLGQYGLYHDDYRLSHSLIDPPATALALLVLGALVVAALALRKRRPLLALGILWFLAAHALTATIVPLELVFEHRNYFASLGVCLALADLLVVAPRQGPARRIGGLLAAIAVSVFATATLARSLEWSDPYRFAATEAARHPGSPRATYGLGQTLVIMTGYRADSPLLDPAAEALERARHVPGAGILPAQGLLMLASMTGRPLREEWWQEIVWRLRHRPVGAQEISALETLTRCARDGHCSFPKDRMVAVFEAAMQEGHPDILTLRGDYALNVLGDPDLALALWRRARDANPNEPQYRINLIKLLIARGRTGEAQRELAALRALGRFGQNDFAADALAQRLPGQTRETPHGGHAD